MTQYPENPLTKLITSLHLCAADSLAFSNFIDIACEVFNAKQGTFLIVDKAKLKVITGSTHGYPSGLIAAIIKSNLIFKDESVIKALEQSVPNVSCFSNFGEVSDISQSLGLFSRNWINATGIVDCALTTAIHPSGYHIILILNMTSLGSLM